MVKYQGIEIQLVEIPGLIQGASEDKGGQRRLLSVIRDSDGIVFMCDATKGIEDLLQVQEEMNKSGIHKKSIIVVNKVDIVPNKLQEITNKFNVLEISVSAGKNIELLKKEIFNLTGLIRVFPCKTQQPIALKQGASVRDFASKIHKDFVQKFKAAFVSGKSVKFSRQQVGLDHTLQDGDIVELKLEK